MLYSRAKQYERIFLVTVDCTDYMQNKQKTYRYQAHKKTVSVAMSQTGKSTSILYNLMHFPDEEQDRLQNDTVFTYSATNKKETMPK